MYHFLNISIFLSILLIMVVILEKYIFPEVTESIYSISVCADKQWKNTSQIDGCLTMLNVVTTLIYTGIVSAVLLFMLMVRSIEVRSTKDMFIIIGVLSLTYPIARLVAHSQSVQPFSQGDTSTVIIVMFILNAITLFMFMKKNYLRDAKYSLCTKDCFTITDYALIK